jgi:hypothetical protein
MTQTAFRTYSVSASDFPITLTISTQAPQLPDFGQVAFRTKDLATGAVTTATQKLVINPDKTATLAIAAPPANSQTRLAIVVHFPAAFPADKSLALSLAPAAGPKLADTISPDDFPVVISNYTMNRA